MKDTRLPPLIFIHGLGGTKKHFAPQVDDLASDFDVLAFELPGHGSAVSSPPDHFHFQFIADSLFKKIRDSKWGDRKPIIIGHSIGGLVAIETASRFPSLLAGIMPIDSTFLIPEADSRTLHTYDLLHESPNYAEVLASFARDVLTNELTAPGLRDQLIEEFSGLPSPLWGSYWPEMLAFRARDKLNAMNLPLTYLHSIAPTDVHALAEILPQARIVEFPTSGHYLQLEKPGRVNHLIREFVRSVAGVK
jgi:N-formylmaleamate deformylase